MEPASAAVAFVGFAGSIASLAGAVIHSCQILHKFCKEYTDAPQNVGRLSDLVGRLALVLGRIKQLEDDSAAHDIDEDVQAFWCQQSKAMRHDLQTFEEKVSKLEIELLRKSGDPRRILTRLKAVFAKEGLANYERIFSDHIDSANFMLNVATSTTVRGVSRLIGQQTAKFEHISHTVERIQPAIKRESVAKQVLIEHYQNKGGLADGIAAHLQDIDVRYCTSRQALALGMVKTLPISDGCIEVESENVITKRKDQDMVLAQGAGRCRSSIRKTGDNSKSMRHIGGTDTKATASWTVSIHKLPIGLLTVYTRRSSEQGSGEPLAGQTAHLTRWSVSFNLYPAAWIAKTAIKLSIDRLFPRFRASSVSYGLDYATYNDDPELLGYLRSSDVKGICRLLETGKARTTDIVPPWGNSLLHEVVLSYMSGHEEEALELCNLLLDHGADPNYRNASGRTPLLYCCVLMKNSHDQGARLCRIAETFIQRGTDLSLCDASGQAPCSLIFQSFAGLDFLEQFVYRFVDLFTFQEMASSDAWILAAVARTRPQFQARLEAELASYRTASSLSTARSQATATVAQLHTSTQVLEVQRADRSIRTTFLESLCANGTTEMIRPFLEGGIDVNETQVSHARTYARAAARSGSLEILQMLVRNGASIHVEAKSMSDDHEGPIDDLFERWHGLRHQRPEYHGDPAAELWILPELLLNDTFNGNDVLFRAICTEQPEDIFRYLLDAGCGRRDGILPKSWKQKVYGSEVIEAIKCNEPMFELMLQYGLAMECEDRMGWTALLHALDRGPGVVNFTELLVAAGVDVGRRAACGMTPLEVAKRSLSSSHPRQPRLSWTINKKPITLAPVSFQDDEAAFLLLSRALEHSQTWRTSFPQRNTHVYFDVGLDGVIKPMLQYVLVAMISVLIMLAFC